MAKLDFPVATADGQLWIGSNGVIYTYIGIPPNGHWSGYIEASSDTLDDFFVRITGDNMSGDLTLGVDKIILNATGDATFTGTVTSANSFAIQLEADDDTKYSSTTNENGEVTRVYNGAILDIKESVTRTDAALQSLKSAIASTTDYASLKAALITALANI